MTRSAACAPEQARPVPLNPGRVVVAGGSGLIGSHLIPALVAAGHDVVVLSRSLRKDAGRVKFVQWCPGVDGRWQDTLDGADAVINLCGANVAARRWTERRKHQLVDSRTLPSQALVTAANRLEHPPAAILQASGVNYYGTGEEPRDESSAPGCDFLAHLACAWEAPVEKTLIRTVVLRFGVVLDSRQGALPQMLLPFRLFVGGPVAGGNQWLSWIHIRDAVDAILFLMDSPLADAVNVTAPAPVRNAEFARTAGRTLHRPAFVPMPRWVFTATLGEAATIVCDGVQALPGKLEAAGFAFRFPELGGAVKDLVGSPQA